MTWLGRRAATCSVAQAVVPVSHPYEQGAAAVAASRSAEPMVTKHSQTWGDFGGSYKRQ